MITASSSRPCTTDLPLTIISDTVTATPNRVQVTARRKTQQSKECSKVDSVSASVYSTDATLQFSFAGLASPAGNTAMPGSLYSLIPVGSEIAVCRPAVLPPHVTTTIHRGQVHFGHFGSCHLHFGHCRSRHLHFGHCRSCYLRFGHTGSRHLHFGHSSLEEEEEEEEEKEQVVVVEEEMVVMEVMEAEDVVEREKKEEEENGECAAWCGSPGDLIGEAECRWRV
ncbi:hypothetical protein O3P69_010903 [Scylla paramamosain]|uniref:C2H2-type domain-containing protein n=1 Tax=Scylla paramamosain TaxID=85552 RepID=A0AAW0TIW2_SCYPA